MKKRVIIVISLASLTWGTAFADEAGNLLQQIAFGTQSDAEIAVSSFYRHYATNQEVISSVVNLGYSGAFAPTNTNGSIKSEAALCAALFSRGIDLLATKSSTEAYFLLTFLQPSCPTTRDNKVWSEWWRRLGHDFSLTWTAKGKLTLAAVLQEVKDSTNGKLEPNAAQPAAGDEHLEDKARSQRCCCGGAGAGALGANPVVARGGDSVFGTVPLRMRYGLL